MMELMLKIAGGAAAACLCAAALRRSGPEFSVVIMLAAGIWVLSMTVRAAVPVIRTFSDLVEKTGLESGLVQPVFQVTGLAIVTKIAGEVCRAAGEGGIAAFVEVTGTILALAATAPLVDAVVDMMSGMLV